MAGEIKNIAKLFSSTKTRTVVLFTMFILAVGIGVSYYVLKGRLASSNLPAGANLQAAPGIQSIPGSLNPTTQYASLQERQNKLIAEQALKKGTSALPTIIRSEEVGGNKNVNRTNGSGASLAQANAPGSGGAPAPNANNQFGSATSIINLSPAQKAALLDEIRDQQCSVPVLEKARNAGMAAKDLKPAGCDISALKQAGYSALDLRNAGYDAAALKNAGFSASDLRDAGFTPEQLKAAGFTASDLKNAGFSPANLRRAGYTASQLKAAGFTPDELRTAGYSACDMKDVGYTARELLNAGYSAQELKGAGFPNEDIETASATTPGLPSSITPQALIADDCDPAKLKQARIAGASVEAIKRITGCSAGALLNAGYTPADLRRAGYTAAELKQAGINDQALKQAGYTARDLLNAGYTPDELRKLGYTPQEITQAQKYPVALPAGITIPDVAAMGCVPERLRQERNQGVDATAIRNIAGCTRSQLLAAGYTPSEVAAAEKTGGTGFIPKGESIEALRAAGCSTEALRRALDAGISAQAIRNIIGCTATDLSLAGYSPTDLKKAGYSVGDLRKAGIANPQQLRAAGLTADDMKNAGISAADLKNAGFTAQQLHDAGFTAQQLRAAGFTAQQLKDAGFTSQEAKRAGSTAKELLDSGFNAQQLKTTGFNAAELRAGGAAVRQLREAGFSPKEIRDAGYTPEKMREGGVSAEALKSLGYSPQALKKAGFTAKELKNAGYTAPQLAGAGFSLPQLAAAGFTAQDINTVASNGGNLTSGLPTSGGGGEAMGTGGTPNVPSLGGAPTMNGADANNTTAQLNQVLQQQSQVANAQQTQQELSNMRASMQNQAQQLVNGWQNVSTQNVISSTLHDKSTTAGGGIGANAGQVGAGDSSGAGSGLLIKAGDIMFAVLNTAVNSDEPGPVLATVVDGKLKGAKLIGSLSLTTRYAQKVVLSFNRLSMPGIDKTISINAVAIDPATARTALSSDTDNHYLLRYGSVFAAAFISGLGNATSSSGATITQDAEGRTTATNTALTGGQKALVALGQVGTTMGDIFSRDSNRPPTVQVFAGVGMGILFMNDVNVPLPQQQETNDDED